MSVVEDITSKVNGNLTNQSFEDHEDNVKRRSNGPFHYCSGHEFWIKDGKIENVEVNNARIEEGSYIANVKFAYHAKYEHKFFDVGWGCNHTDESKNPTGTVEFVYKRDMFGFSINDFKLTNPDPSEAHDSTRMCKEELLELVHSKLSVL